MLGYEREFSVFGKLHSPGFFVCVAQPKNLHGALLHTPPCYLLLQNDLMQRILGACSIALCVRNVYFSNKSSTIFNLHK